MSVTTILIFPNTLIQDGKMIETSVKIHDKFSFEFKISFISDKTIADSQEEFSVNTWLLVPNSLEINGDTYPKTDFFKDINSKIRLITPDFPIAEIVSDNPESPKNKLIRALHEALHDPASDEKGEQFVHDVKIFANICKSSIRDEVMFEVYLNNPREVPPNELLTEICLPLQTVAVPA